MSGHNKWSKIKRKKGALDAKRSKIFTKLIKEMSIAVRESGANPDMNPRLRVALTNAKGVNMPKDTIQRAISKASDKNAASYSEVVHEGYGTGGVAIFVECTTDNTNRTLSNIRLYFSKFGCELGTKGSLTFLFDRKGVFTVPKGNLNEDEFMMEVIDAGAEDVEFEDNVFTIYTSFENYGAMQKKLEAMNIEPESTELQRIPKTTTQVDIDTAKKVMRLIETIEEDEDVQNVFHNMEMTEEIVNVMAE